MFGGDMMQKLMAMKQQAEAVKDKLNQKFVSGEAGGGLVHVEMNGNRLIKKIEVNTELSTMEKEDLEDLLTVAFNRALEEANKLQEAEMADNVKGLFPGM